MTAPSLSAPLAPRVRPKASLDQWTLAAGLMAVAALLVVFVGLPLYALLSKSFEDANGVFVGLANYAKFLETPALSASAANSFTISIITAVVTTTLAFVYAYALTRSCMKARAFFKGLALLPLLAPSLLPGISLVYLFGNQGLLKSWMMGASIYGPIGIVIGEVFYTFPHALLILLTALSITDARLYEAADVLGAGAVRKFLTVTLPGARYGLISAFFVVFTLVITDFGVPKVIGGNYNVLATDVYKQVVGRHDFQMGAVVGMILLLPALLAFAVDRFVQKRQVALLSARAVPFTPKPSRGFDAGDGRRGNPGLLDGDAERDGALSRGAGRGDQRDDPDHGATAVQPLDHRWGQRALELPGALPGHVLRRRRRGGVPRAVRRLGAARARGPPLPPGAAHAAHVAFTRGLRRSGMRSTAGVCGPSP